MDNNNILSAKTHGVVTDEAGHVVLVNGRLMLQHKLSGDVLYAPFTEAIQSVFNIKPAEERHEQCEADEEEVLPTTTEGEGSSKLWTKTTTVVLIQKIKEMGDQFDNEIKKSVYTKLAIQLQNEFQRTFTAANIETKWKALKRTYKSTILHNNTSGKDRRKWEYFELMHDLLFHKPEITPPATCSNIAGLKVSEPNCDSGPSTSTTPSNITQQTESRAASLESSFSRKRKQRVSDVAKRHAEKMARFDRFNDLFKQMVEKKE